MQKFWATGGRLVGGAPLSLLQWAPTLTVHDPSPPITLESPSGGAPATLAAGAQAVTVTAATATAGAAVALSAGGQALLISGSAEAAALVLLGAGPNALILSGDAVPVAAVSLLAGNQALLLSGDAVAVAVASLLAGDQAVTLTPPTASGSYGPVLVSAGLQALILTAPATLDAVPPPEAMPTAPARAWRVRGRREHVTARYPGLELARKARGGR